MRVDVENGLEKATRASEDVQQVEREPRRVFVPRVRTRDHDDRIDLNVELPGVRREDLDLEVEGRVLTIRGRSADWTVPDGMRPVLAELEQGDYEARLSLPRGIAADRIEARLEAGVLSLVLPREAPQRRTIPVSAR